MRITVTAKPGSKHAKVVKTDATHYEISVTAVAEKGKATDAVRRSLAQELKIAPSRISLVMGAASRTKVFEVR